jgi:carbon-monoxide dehydrogenase medium subunit
MLSWTLKLPPFVYRAPESLEEGLELLAAGDGEARVLAGGQSLIPMLALRLARPSLLVDLRRVPGLAVVEADGAGLRIGALTTELVAERDPLVRARSPLLLEALDFIGHPAIRSRGTVVGSLCHADPAAELPAAALVLGAELTARSLARGSRTIPARDFFLGPFTTSLEFDEVVTEVRVPAPPPSEGTCFMEVSRRPGDFAMVGVAAAVVRDGDRLVDLRLALSGVGDHPRLLTLEELELEAQAPAESLFSDAGRSVAARLRPPEDLHASATYRRHLAGVLTERALRSAFGRAATQGGAAGA